MIKIIIAVVSLILVAGSLIGMSIFKTKYCIFSRFEGTLMHDGKPVSGVKIVRKMSIDDTYEMKVVEEVVTNEKGEFKFESRWEKVSMPMLSEFRILQEAYAYYQGEEIDIWGSARSRSPDEYDEFAGNYKNLICELTKESEKLRFKHHRLSRPYTKCSWDIIEKVSF